MISSKASDVLPRFPPLILNSLPKSGTNLLTRVFEALPGYAHSGEILTAQTAVGREDASSGLLVGVSTPRGMRRTDFVELMQGLNAGQFHYGHVPYSRDTREVLDNYGIRMVAILRDPRAVVCSFVHFILSLEEHPFYPSFASEETHAARIELAIRGFPPSAENGNAGLMSIAECFRSIADWAEWPAAALISFEELIGPRGGGTIDAQQQVLDRILGHIGYELDEPARVRLGQQLFSETSITFRKGQIGSWRDEFTPRIERYFEWHAGESLKDFRRIFTDVPEMEA